MRKKEVLSRSQQFLTAAVLLGMFFLAGCGRGEPESLLILCGGGIRPPLDGESRADEPGILRRFEELHPGLSLEANYGASNILLGQLQLTRSGDLFFPGDDFYIEEAKKEGLVHATRTVAWFVPVIMVAGDNPHGIRNVSDLAGPDVRLAVADPRAAAIGRITPEIFSRNGLDYDELDNIEYTGVTAPEIAQAVDLGHVDAAIVWRPVAKQYPRGNLVVDIEPEKNVLSPLVIAVLETSENKERALQFADFISGEEGREVFREFHYDVRDE